MKSHTIAKLFTSACLLAATVGCQSESNSDGLSKLDSSGTTRLSLPAEQKECCENSGAETLAEQLAEKANQSAATAPLDRRNAFEAGIDIVKKSGIETSAKQVGDMAIDDELIGWDGKTFRLSELWQKRPVVLMWYRGGWCPYCNIQLRAMQQKLDEFGNAGARLVVLTPELPDCARKTAKANGLEVVALHDRNNHLANQYGIVFDLPSPITPIFRDRIKLPSYNGNDDLQLPLAATYVINQSGKITYAFLDADHKKRAEPAEVLEAIQLIAAAN